jgi:sucrose-6-phosphate hydrolase SacC (GH32 family)
MKEYRLDMLKRIAKVLKEKPLKQVSFGEDSFIKTAGERNDMLVVAVKVAGLFDTLFYKLLDEKYWKEISVFDSEEQSDYYMTTDDLARIEVRI